MCGICGIVDFSENRTSEDTLWAMTNTLRHRGPDDSGIASIGPAGLGHTRLTIIDLTKAGHQPMESQDESMSIVYNGELYNFRDLRRRLEAEGVSFRSRSDSEVLLESFVRWGTDALIRFNGMFAFAIWHNRKEELHLARDRFGIKPLYYVASGSRLVFGSEVKALFAAQEVGRQIHWPAMHTYLYYGYTLGSTTLFDGIEQLKPGHYLKFSRHGIESQPYWSIADVRPVNDDEGIATATLREKLGEAVRDHLVSDVPVGVFLSGGIDSSAITALGSEHYAGRLKTYSVGFDFESGANELPKAKTVADQFDTEHHELHCAGADIKEVIEKLVHCHDAPFGDAANIPLYLLCEQLRGSAKVILQGDGGDEIFGGYRRYNVLSFGRLWRFASLVGNSLTRIGPNRPAYYQMIRFFRAMAQSDPALRMAMLMTQETLDDPPTRLLSTEALAQVGAHDPFGRYREMNARFSHLDPVQRMMFTDSAVILPDSYLEKVDRSTMAHSIEVRVPFLDVNLTEYAMGLPASSKIRRGQKKWLLRRALRGLLPDAILDGKKTGFGVPMDHWLRGPLAEYMRSVLMDPGTVRWGFFDRNRMEECMRAHIEGKRNLGSRLYRMLVLALWYRFYIDR